MHPQQTILWLINLLFEIVIILFALRLIVEWVRTDFYNPICQWLARMTQPLIYPLSRIIPNYHSINLACITLLLVIAAEF